MPSYGELNGRKGFIISENDFNKMEAIMTSGKKIYFIPTAVHKPKELDIKIEQLIIDGLSKKDIAERIGLTRSGLNGRLAKKYNTVGLDEIRHKLLSSRDERKQDDL